MEKKDKDLCLTCEHYWEDFPMPLEYAISHCDIVDEKYRFKPMDLYVAYPCLECPFNCYSPKKMKSYTNIEQSKKLAEIIDL